MEQDSHTVTDISYNNKNKVTISRVCILIVPCLSLVHLPLKYHLQQNHDMESQERNGNVLKKRLRRIYRSPVCLSATTTTCSKPQSWIQGGQITSGPTNKMADLPTAPTAASNALPTVGIPSTDPWEGIGRGCPAKIVVFRKVSVFTHFFTPRSHGCN